MTTFERIQHLAKKRDKSLKEVSLELGYSKNYLYTLKTKEPSADKLNALADYFNVSVDYLLGREEKQNTDNSNIADQMYIAFRKNEERLPEDKREEYRLEMERYMRFIMSEMEKDD